MSVKIYKVNNIASIHQPSEYYYRFLDPQTNEGENKRKYIHPIDGKSTN